MTQRLDGSSIRVDSDVCVRLATELLPLQRPDRLFCALVTESGATAPDAAEPAREARNEARLGIRVMKEVYGLRATLSVSRGLLPPPEVDDKAVRDSERERGEREGEGEGERGREREGERVSERQRRAPAPARRT